MRRNAGRIISYCHIVVRCSIAVCYTAVLFRFIVLLYLRLVREVPECCCCQLLCLLQTGPHATRGVVRILQATVQAYLAAMQPFTCSGQCLIQI